MFYLGTSVLIHSRLKLYTDHGVRLWARQTVEPEEPVVEPNVNVNSDRRSATTAMVNNTQEEKKTMCNYLLEISSIGHFQCVTAVHQLLCPTTFMQLPARQPA